MVFDIYLNKGKTDLSLLNEDILLNIISDKEVISLEVNTIIDIVYSKLPIKANVISVDLAKNDTNSAFEYKVKLNLDLEQIRKSNPDVLLNIGTVNFKISNQSEQDKVIILQIVKEGNTFYKNLIS